MNENVPENGHKWTGTDRNVYDHMINGPKRSQITFTFQN
jgi:hypothetical protein